MSDPGSCPACGGPLVAWRSVPSSDPALGNERFELRRCTRCQSAATVGSPPPNAYEVGAYAPGKPHLHRPAGPVLRLFDRQRLSLIRALAPPPARLIDAGAGRGRFVASARAAGYRSTGIEPSARGGASGGDGALQRATIEGASVEPGSVEVVTAWHVLEHLDAPREAVARIAGWLSPGGVLLVGVPNLSSLQARLGGERWYHLDVPRHRVHFTPQGMRSLLTEHGLQVVHTHHLLLEHNPFGMWQSLLSRLTRHPSYVYNALKRNAPLRSRDAVIAAAGVPLLPLAALLEAAAGLSGRGGTIAVAARRASSL